ncbi:type III pantothenate kinase [Methylococcaceae bacterium CS1]|nr:type III pantothenate kinase [Methyloprofundus sp.]TXK94485.1 type III pantothenate kinase [Methylococcaceae bacterium CS4]TXK95379.1 type III pantothenate kinase [Methylococcaceae bacterium CS5]TXL04020.1 type III pantothenate kinase [Methylococcaceae bacterium CS3]TXL05491.1 type III pantothenate kinase [Methylococcaceae bacterium CS1]TXL09316.1 type III pantothenate kinase [Methylococcaceae bacterium CS2]
MILIDIGNTRLKWAEQQTGQLGEMHAVVHSETNFQVQLTAAWQQLTKPESIYLACVSSARIKLQVIQIAEQLWPDVKVQEIHTEKYVLGVSNAYPKYEKLGVDRWLSILAAYHFYSAPVCVIACGTALTLDIVNQQGQHMGGMIMPGLSLMKQALSKGTANLNFCSEQYPQGLANDTEAAIYNGNINAIKGFIMQGLAEYQKPVQLIMTGGDAQLLIQTLKLEAINDAQLVLKGLALVASE